MTHSIVSPAFPYGEPTSEHRRRLTGKHSTNDTRGKRPWIAAAGALVVVAVAFAWGNHEPAATVAVGGGGNTGNAIVVD